MATLPVQGLRTHAQKVCNLYKRAVRDMECWYHERDEFRYQAAVMRSRFEVTRNEKDMIKATEMLAAAEKELFMQQHYAPRKFAYSPEGVAYGRTVTPPDWVLDYWHPLEKAQYPEYFARREERKKEYVIWWEKQYGKPKPDENAHH